MTTRLIVMEVPDLQSQEDLTMAIAVWNDKNPDRAVTIIQQTNLILGRNR